MLVLEFPTVPAYWHQLHAQAAHAVNQQYLVEVGKHVALALDGALSQADKHARLAWSLLHDRVADMHAAGEAVALHAAGHIHSVPQEAVARAFHANHTSIGWTTMHSCRHHVHTLHASHNITMRHFCRYRASMPLLALRIHTCDTCRWQKPLIITKQMCMGY